MLNKYLSVIVLVVMCHAVIGQDDEEIPDEWEAQKMPNPDRRPEMCGHGRKSGFLCDPNRILSPRSAELINWLLEGFYNNDTKCPCSTYSCEMTKRGSHLSVAIVRRMKLADTFDDHDAAAMQAASHFALQLQENVWNFGQCENDIVIFYSKDDGVLFISYGPTVGHYLNNNKVENIQRMFGHHFQRGNEHDIFTGIVDIIRALRDVLNGYNYYDPNMAHFETPIGGASHVTSGVLATTALAVLSTHLFSQ